nr:hypothetical protein [Homoserinibacter gongjuensis]
MTVLTPAVPPFGPTSVAPSDQLARSLSVSVYVPADRPPNTNAPVASVTVVREALPPSTTSTPGSGVSPGSTTPSSFASCQTMPRMIDSGISAKS